MSRLIGKLFDGPLDIVADIHGEIDPLHDLLDHLGYRANGSHAAGRRLVFVGDLVDRGPDSPAVVDKVAGLVAAGRAQCVLGNHELNLLRNARKKDNGWWHAAGADDQHSVTAATDAFRQRARAFLATLPLALEREDLRVVHASWHHESIAALRAEQRSVVEIYADYEARIEAQLQADGTAQRRAAEKAEYGSRLHDENGRVAPVPFLPAHARWDELGQMGNPVKVITSGEETKIAGDAPEPFWVGGKWRMIERQPWWVHYGEHEPPVVNGHYWRRYDGSDGPWKGRFGPNLFAGIPAKEWMGRHRNVYCIDFSVGGKFWERANKPERPVCKLAALQVPQWRVVFDDGEVWQLPPPG